jgi:3-(3-hydroxy-phenyl)propionate hydroxylase
MPRGSVLVVGAGPTGLVAAALLGSLGVRTTVVERNAATSDEPKAVTIDDVALRTLQRAGIAGDVYGTLLQGTGTRYYGRRGQLLTYARGHPPFRAGHPVKNPFQQPELEAQLVRSLGRFPSVEVRFDRELTALSQTEAGVVGRVVGTGGATEEIAADYVLGCDGGRSTVRSLLGIQMTGSSYTEPWLVVDTLNDSHDERYAMHHGDPRQPHLVVPGKDGNCRYEFLMAPGQAPAGAPPSELVRELVRPYRRLRDGDIRRSAIYTFHALVAQRWQSGRCFLLGDAAHMMPPFAGAGLNTGIRDADNLTWKVAAALAGGATRGCPELLETFELERRPYAEAMIRLSVRLGSIVMTRSRARAWLRDAAARLCNLVPAGRSYLSDMRFRPEARYERGFVLAGPPTRAIVGRALPQPTVVDAAGRRLLLDDVLGPSFSLLAVDPVDADPFRGLTHPIWESLGAARVGVALDDRAARPTAGAWRSVADFDGTLGGPLGDCRGRLLLVRPDRFVAAAFTPDQHDAVARQLGSWVGGAVPAAVPGAALSRTRAAPADR